MIDVSKSRFLTASATLLLTAALLAGCGSDSDNKKKPPAEPELERVHDGRSFTAVEPSEEMLKLLNDGLNAEIYGGLHKGERGDASYIIQVPTSWNGVLVMYAHGYRGEGEELTVTPPRIARNLIEAGYAWAASSYSANYYDVRAGVEDTNALAKAFTELTGDAHGKPNKYYIIGHSMGGHIAGAAIEDETLATANNKVEYAAALPMCGVMGDTELFDYFAAWNRAAQKLAGFDEPPSSADEYQNEVRPKVIETLWEDYQADLVWAGTPTDVGRKLLGMWANLTGGPRPIFEQAAVLKQWNELILNYGVPEGTIAGILNRNVVDTTHIVYRWQSLPGAALTAAEQQFNDAIFRHKPDAGANDKRDDGLRWIPQVQGRFSVPVVTLHTLGDLFVPFSMQQIYTRRAAENGNDEWLVQRAIRSPGHCDFSTAEEWRAFQDLAAWEAGGTKPTGDDVLNPATVGAPDFGCAFTNNTDFTATEADLKNTRAAMPACDT